MLGIINRGVSYKSAELISKLFRSYLDYCIQFRTPISVKDTDILEKLQRRAMKMIPILRNIIGREIEKVRHVFFKA